MDKEPNQENPSLLSNTKQEYSPTKPPTTPTAAAAAAAAGDRLKRDEWSEGAVSSLLEAYEAKWVLRNRAKLKGQDWEDVAKYVSARGNGSSKSPKTQTQCKNKIESMKKRYRSESSAADGSSWPLYSRLDLLLRGSAPLPPPPLPPAPPPPLQHLPPPPATAAIYSPLVVVETSLPPPQPPLALPLPVAAPPPTLVIGVAQNSHGSNGADRGPKEDGVSTKLYDHESDKNQPVDTDSSTPALYSDEEKMKSKNSKPRLDKKKRRRGGEVAESIRLLAEVVVRSEQARMETMRELEKMRAEAEAKRGELDLKRTEIVANTQLEIARMFAGVGKGIDSSLRIGRS